MTEFRPQAVYRTCCDCNVTKAKRYFSKASGRDRQPYCQTCGVERMRRGKAVNLTPTGADLCVVGLLAQSFYTARRHDE